MRCKNCDYRLWNLSTRQCPECGTPFKPSDYEFVLNSVQFRCPYCNQDYYGTGAKGHLWPIEFDCVRCGKHIHMDQMVLLPTANVSEQRTRVESNPWLERAEVGRVKAWFKTLGRAMGTPGALMRSTPPMSSTGQAFWFALVTTSIYYAMATLPMAVFMLIMFSARGGGRGGPGFGIAGGTFAGLAAGFVVVTMLFVGLWGLLAHALLAISGGAPERLGRTYQAICYGSGANVLSAVPCFAFYFWWLGGIWWIVSAILMVKEGQRVHGGRATFAVLTPALVAVLATIGLFVASIVMTTSFAGGSMAIRTSVTTQLGRALKLYAGAHNGRGPTHAIELVGPNGPFGYEFVSTGTMTTPSDVPLGGNTLATFQVMQPPQQQAIVQAVAGAMPTGVVAHRLGDFVFTYHGIDFNNANPGLWTMILSPEPSVNAGLPAEPFVVVGLTSGAAKRIPVAQWPTQLSAQNALRAKYNLPPLPDPATVTHAKPAVPPAPAKQTEPQPEP